VNNTHSFLQRDEGEPGAALDLLGLHDLICTGIGNVVELSTPRGTSSPFGDDRHARLVTGRLLSVELIHDNPGQIVVRFEGRLTLHIAAEQVDETTFTEWHERNQL
jgi:hypothetical protein